MKKLPATVQRSVPAKLELKSGRISRINPADLVAVAGGKGSSFKIPD